MEPERSVLDEIFSQSEEELETFMEAISRNVNPEAALSEVGADSEDIDAIRSGKAQEISSPELVTQIIGQIQITHGWDGGDYVWHICTTDMRIPWKVTDHRLCFGVSKVMTDTIPQTCIVDIWLPIPTWEIVEYTFKAMDLRSCWQITEESIAKMNRQLFEVLNTMI